MPVYLRHLDSLVELIDGVFFVGRSSGCDLPLDDGLVSRKHAKFMVSGARVVLEDLGSRNGTFRNGQRLHSEAVVLEEGDSVTLGSHEFIVTFQKAAASSKRERVPTAPTLTTEPDAPDDETTRVSGIALLLNLAAKSLALGRFPDGERLLSPLLERFVGERAEKFPEAVALVQRAAQLCLELAVGTRSAKWVDTVFALYEQTRSIPNAEVVDQLHDVVRSIGYLELVPIRSCLTKLRDQPSLSPREKFLLQRLRGLEQVIAA